MSSVPREVLRDVLQPLDRWTLDGVQFTSRRFLQLIMEHMSDVCLRRVDAASFRARDENTVGSSYAIYIYRRPEREISNAHEDAAHLFSEFVQVLRSSRVAHLQLSWVVFTPILAAHVLQVTIVADTLSLVEGSCAELTPSQLRRVFLHFSPNAMFLGSLFRACQISDELVRALFENRVRFVSFPNKVPVDGGSFCVTDDAIVELCAQQTAQNGQEGDKPVAGLDLSLYNGSFTKDLFKRLVEANTRPMRAQSLRIVVSPSRVEKEDVSAFAQQLSYRYRGRRRQLRIYNFPDEQQRFYNLPDGQQLEVAGMRLQIVLHPDNRLEMIREGRGHPNFKESDE